MASALALSPNAVSAFSEKLSHSSRPSVIWLSFQECTGCTESLTRSHAPTIESLIFDYLSLDYHHTLQEASGEAAEAARDEAMKQNYGKYLLVVDGSIPLAMDGACSMIAGRTNLDILKECAEGAAAIIAIGTCAAFGGLPGASPNPTGAVSVAALMQDGFIAKQKLVNISGCPPLPIAISSVLAHFLAFDRFPVLDEFKRPIAFYGNTIHDRFSRYHFYQDEKFAESFDDEGAKKGWCLYKLGCKGPTTHNACAIYKWNGGASFPIESGHPCIGCSEPGFWDNGPFYSSLDNRVNFDRVDDGVAGIKVGNTAEEGQIFYDNNCVYCHPDDPVQLDTDLDKVVDVLRSGNVRAHRRIDYSDDQIKSLESYLKSLK